jgi:hypothetical protein
MSAFAVVAQLETLCMAIAVQVKNSIGIAKASVCLLSRKEALDMAMVRGKSLRLTIWSVRTTNFRTYLSLVQRKRHFC